MTFSLLIPTRHRQEKLGKCLQSVVKNSLHPNELVVVDSSNNWPETKKLVYSFRNKLPNTKIIYKKVKHVNVAYSRNQALKLAHGEILGFIDDDVLLEKNWLKKVLATHQKYPKIPEIGGRTLNLNKNNYWAEISSKISESFLENPHKVHYPATLPCLNLSFKNHFLKNRQLSFNESLMALEDVEFSLRIRKLGYKILYDPQIKVWHNYRSSFFTFFKQQFWYGRGYQKLKPLKNRLLFFLSLSKIVIRNTWRFCKKNPLPFKYSPGIMTKELAFSLGVLYQSLEDGD